MAAEGDAALADAAVPPGESASRTFFTTIDAEPKVKHKDGHRGKQLAKQQQYCVLQSTPSGPRIVQYHEDLTNLAQTLDTRVSALLREHEKDFFLAYKTHMYTVQKEIKTLRAKADFEEARTKEDTKIKALERELDWFMTEAVRLDELCRGYKKEVDKWKAKADALDEDRRFLEDQIKGAKRQNKILRAAAERARSSAYSALMATRAKTEAGEGQQVGEGGYPNGQLALTAPDMAAAPKRRPRSASGSDGARPAAGAGVMRALEARSRTPDARASGALVPSSSSTTALVPHEAGMPSSPHILSTVSLSSIGHRSILGNDAEERYVEAIQHLKESIIREQHTVRMLQAARANSYSQKSEMEEFFLKCIDEARKELNRKRHLTLYKEKSDRQRALEAMLNNEEVLVCLYEKLFPHRTGIARSLGGGGGEDTRLLSQPLEDHGH